MRCRSAAVGARRGSGPPVLCESGGVGPTFQERPAIREGESLVPASSGGSARAGGHGSAVPPRAGRGCAAWRSRAPSRSSRGAVRAARARQPRACGRSRSRVWSSGAVGRGAEALARRRRTSSAPRCGRRLRRDGGRLQARTPSHNSDAETVTSSCPICTAFVPEAHCPRTRAIACARVSRTGRGGRGAAGQRGSQARDRLAQACRRPWRPCRPAVANQGRGRARRRASASTAEVATQRLSGWEPSGVGPRPGVPRGSGRRPTRRQAVVYSRGGRRPRCEQPGPRRGCL